MSISVTSNIMNLKWMDSWMIYK